MPPSPRRRHQPSGQSPSLDQEIYTLAVTSEQPPGEGNISVQASMSLAELHGYIADMIGINMELPYKFSVTPPGGTETTIEHGPRSLLGGLGLIEGSEFSYAIDEPAEEDLPAMSWRLRLRVAEVGKAQPEVQYPRSTSWGIHDESDGDDDGLGELPPIDEDLKPLVAELSALPETKPDIESQIALARRLLEQTASRPEQFDAIGAEVSDDLEAWVWMLFGVLMDRRRFEEADQMLARMESMPDAFPETRGSRATLLVHQGRTDEARALVNALLSTGNAGEDLRAHALDPLIALGSLKEAEELAYQLRRSHHTPDQLDAIGALITVYQRTGRKREARKLEADFDKLAQRYDRESRNAEENLRTMVEGFAQLREAMQAQAEGKPVAPFKLASAPAAKVGRNDPCTCGSGKKYKKCCGA